MNLRKVFKEKDILVVFKNLISLSLLQLINLILPFITLPYIARVVGVENFGILAFSSAIIVFFLTVVDYGFNYTAVRDGARVKEDKIAFSKILSTVFYSKIILFLISFLIFSLLVFFVPLFQKNALILYLSFFSVFSTVFYQEWLFQALEKMHLLAFLSLISKVLYTIAIFLLIKKSEDFYLVPVINAISILITGMISLYLIVSKLNLKFVVIPIVELITYLKSGFNMFISLFIPNLYTNISFIWLSQFHGKFATGIFDAGYKINGISQTLSSVLSRAFFPLLSRKINFHNFYIKLNLALALVSSSILFLFSDIIVSIMFGEGYEQASEVIKIMSISPIFISLMNIYGTNFLVLKNKESILVKIIIFCSLVGALVTAIFIYFWGYVGAAYSITLVWAIRGFLTMFFAKKMGA
ncbi:oligosaccharide flippase family protein [Acinetobacter sp. YH12254]|uniref:oligosaccharide flippase family protein n=1 Tax=Acinetobacter sp. YH12254 TaxID=2601178 RepID=UPI0015D181C0|nr:oligosaccharide flippase family protein [Acinetobacter sp. YH12254]